MSAAPMALVPQQNSDPALPRWANPEFRACGARNAFVDVPTDFLHRHLAEKFYLDRISARGGVLPACPLQPHPIQRRVTLCLGKTYRPTESIRSGTGSMIQELAIEEKEAHSERNQIQLL